MLCSCHGEPAYWNPDRAMRAGGHWRCAVKKREQQRATDKARRETKLQRRRDKYDTDPVWRIERLLKTAAERRRATLKRRRETLHGALPAEG
jgi:hypothetical protein